MRTARLRVLALLLGLAAIPCKTCHDGAGCLDASARDVAPAPIAVAG